jgi:phosphoribosyl-dephospho-CoA transferase
MDTPRPHDLLFLRHAAAFEACACNARPGWLDTDWLARAPVVVRRAVVPTGRVAVGARGLQRSERCAGHVALADVVRRVTPEDLARVTLDDPGRLASAAATLPCIAALTALAPRLEALGLEWGPAGGTGFWLASDLPVLRPASDLDLLVRAPRRLGPDTFAALRALVDAAPCRVDIQVDTGDGGFALMEYARGGKVLLKTDHGPRLLIDPWEIRVAS